MEGSRPGLVQLKDTRIIYINGAIDDDMACAFNTILLNLEHENPDEDIILYINSPGGSVPAGLSMIDTMNLISCDVVTICVGLAASMGALLLMSGTKGKRKILPHSKTLIHQPLGSFNSGAMQVSDIEIVAKELLRTKEEVYTIISECTGQPYEKICADCDRDHTLTAQAPSANFCLSSSAYALGMGSSTSSPAFRQRRPASPMVSPIPWYSKALLAPP